MKKEAVLEQLGKSSIFYTEIENELLSKYSYINIKLVTNDKINYSFKTFYKEKLIYTCVVNNGYFTIDIKYNISELVYIDQIINDLSPYANKVWSNKINQNGKVLIEYKVENKKTMIEALILIMIKLKLSMDMVFL